MVKISPMEKARELSQVFLFSKKLKKCKKGWKMTNFQFFPPKKS